MPVAGPAAAGLAPRLAADGGWLVASPAAANVVVAAGLNAVSGPAQQSLVIGLRGAGRPVVVLGTGLRC